MSWYLEVLKKYAVFSGRARRKEYWFFALFNIIAILVLGLVDNMAGMFNAEIGLGLLSGLYYLAIVVPSIAVSVRRLHDTGRTGWWVLIAFFPLVGALILLVFMVMDSKPGTNQYGDNPKETVVA
ncbi:DUF805 domain-containing protein [Gilvimarinus sp. 1_MG-2023]|uniref:DUF805 domain-containing protein n=1 Tax=Gilvimarinus sp. 1_MG-2023 TaxID=3062638 RepID=UPI0026E1C725|nr:DUF805 domain-containing protein [Gilvimarinus sp. 1_MG-2023]MDO6748485.1 DUF805 domain-containing protein [Gilvimarinus sp. 1_MG-2023]